MKASSTVGMGAALLLAMATMARAEDACAGFHWNVSQERALFATRPDALSPGSNPTSAPLIRADHLYEWTVLPQETVTFAVAPGKKITDGAHAGLARLRLDAAGIYRVSLDQPFWVDVVADGKVIPSKDFQDAPGCQTPHKIVEFELPAGKELLIQLSRATDPRVRMTVTRAPRGE
jgi:hypothetical protein